MEITQTRFTTEYDEGYQAFMEDCLKDENPYPYPSREYRNWREGWQAARADFTRHQND